MIYFREETGLLTMDETKSTWKILYTVKKKINQSIEVELSMWEQWLELQLQVNLETKDFQPKSEQLSLLQCQTQDEESLKQTT